MTPRPTHAPADPMTPVQEAAIAMHEVFTCLKAAGFTETQATNIVIGLMTTTIET